MGAHPTTPTNSGVQDLSRALLRAWLRKNNRHKQQLILHKFNHNILDIKKMNFMCLVILYGGMLELVDNLVLKTNANTRRMGASPITPTS